MTVLRIIFLTHKLYVMLILFFFLLKLCEIAISLENYKINNIKLMNNRYCKYRKQHNTYINLVRSEWRTVARPGIGGLIIELRSDYTMRLDTLLHVIMHALLFPYNIRAISGRYLFARLY